MKQRIFKIVPIVFNLVLFFLIFTPWVVGEESFSLVGYIMNVKREGELPLADRGDLSKLLSYYLMYLPLLGGVLSLVQAFLRIKNRQIVFFTWLIQLSGIVYVLFTVSNTAVIPGYGAILFVAVEVVDFIFLKIADYSADSINIKLLRSYEKKADEEQKKRSAFPGNYSKYFYKVIIANTVSDYRNYILLIFGGFISILFLFVLFSVNEYLVEVHTQDFLFLGNGLQEIIRNSIVTAVVINTIFMTFSFSAFMKSRMKANQFFVILGIRKSTLSKIIVCEYISVIIIALILGCSVGTIVQPIVRNQINEHFDMNLSSLTVKAYLIVIAIYIVLTLFVAIINHQIYLRFQYKIEGYQVYRKENIGKFFLGSIGILGAILFISGLSFFSQRKWGEEIKYQMFFLVGFYAIIVYLLHVFLSAIRKNKKILYRHILKIIPLLSRFKSSILFIFFLVVLHFYGTYTFMFPYLSGKLAAEADELYPYDFVCMAYEDDRGFFEELEEEFELDLTQYPMVRVTTEFGDPYSFIDIANNTYSTIMKPQGQHIGISESTYQVLKRKIGEPLTESLNLIGEDIHVVYQQDATIQSHPFEWFMLRNGYKFRIGQPLDEYLWYSRHSIFPDHSAKSEEIEVLIGMFQLGQQENIVVFSDVYFEELMSVEKEGPTQLYCINTSNVNYNEVNAKLKQFEEKNYLDSRWDRSIKPYYDKQQELKDIESENYLKQIVGLYTIALIAACALLVLYMKYLYALNETVKQYEFYDKLGMRRKEQNKVLSREIDIFMWSVFIVANICVITCTLITFNLRMFTDGEKLEYLKNFVIYAGGYWLLQSIGICVLKYVIIKRIRQKREVR